MLESVVPHLFEVRVSSELEPKDVNFVFVTNDRYFLIATVPDISSISGEGHFVYVSPYVFAKSCCWFKFQNFRTR